MIKRMILILAIAAAIAAGAVEVKAQDVIMNSAETINQGNFKLAVFPTVLFGKNGGESLWGVAGRFGYGFTPDFDIEFKAGFFRGITYLGADAEVWLVKGPSVNFSASVGGHTVNASGPDYSGIDASLLLSTLPMGRLELYGGLKAAFDWIRDTDQSLTRWHFVPGFEWRVGPDLDFLAEVGIALNRNARSYASIGLALYIR